MKTVLSLCTMLLTLLLQVVPVWGAPIARFTFGTPESITRAGFTRVTVNDAFTTERGYGFDTTQGLLAFDRGGAAIARPKDDYTADTYGAYRTSSDLTSALIEGTHDNAFVVALPDGDYTVWMIANDSEWDPPLFDLWSNGVKRLDVRIPRRAYVFMESFRARATQGRLRIDLKGKHGWILSALVIGKDGPDLTSEIAKLERDIFFLTDPELPNWKERKRSPAHPPLQRTPLETKRGYVPFSTDPGERITPDYVPARAQVGKPITAFAALDEIEAATFGIQANRDLGRVMVELSDLVGEKKGQRIARQNVRLGVVRCQPVRVTGEGPKGEYVVAPTRIEPPTGRTSQVSAGQAKQWWLTIRVPDGAGSGRYRMRVTVRPAQAPATVLECRLLVLPFRLSRGTGKHWGTWLESFPPVGGLAGPARRGRNTDAEQTRMARLDLADYRDHGFDLALFNYYFGVEEKTDGCFTYDLAGLPRDMAYWKVVRSNAPVVICCEYAFRDLEYRFAEPGKEHVAGTFSPKAHRAIVGLVQTIRDEANRRGWPPIYFSPIDEPGNSKTANRMQFAERVLEFVHEVPGCKTATTVSASDVQRLGDRVDLRIYAAGNYNRARALQEARSGHPFWFYDNGMFYGHSTMASRNLPGFELLRSGAAVATAWGFDATTGNPENDFDGGHRDWNVIYPGVDGLTPTIYWELCREGVDDCRYVATLQEEIRKARVRGLKKRAIRAEQILAPLIRPDARDIDDPREFNRFRWRIAREIISLRGEKSVDLPFVAALRNESGKEKRGPNQIVNPSFEDGPKEDGFPGNPYLIADQYAKSEARPVDALRVTDEMAHSGRYSLKWDFSKAEGKGSVYGRDHWLIVNVQVSPATIAALRGKRVQVGYWFRLGGGAALPGMTLREFGKGTFLDSISYAGGVADPTVWNHFEAEGRLRSDFDGLDIHIPCIIPTDPEVARKSSFYIDDVTLEAIEEPPLSLTMPLDEYYVGETVPYRVHSTSTQEPIEVILRSAAQPVHVRSYRPEDGTLSAGFSTQGLAPGLYTVLARTTDAAGGVQTARRQFLLTPDPFAWSPPLK